jgi:hypothetical protein
MLTSSWVWKDSQTTPFDDAFTDADCFGGGQSGSVKGSEGDHVRKRGWVSKCGPIPASRPFYGIITVRRERVALPFPVGFALAAVVRSEGRDCHPKLAIGLWRESGKQIWRNNFLGILALIQTDHDIWNKRFSTLEVLI